MQGRTFFARANRGAAPTHHHTPTHHHPRRNRTALRALVTALVATSLVGGLAGCVRSFDSAHAAPQPKAAPTRTKKPATPTRTPHQQPTPTPEQQPTRTPQQPTPSFGRTPQPQAHPQQAPDPAEKTPTPTRTKQPRRTGTQPPKNERTKVYRNSKDFAFLDAARMVVPGGKYFTDNGSCSFGFFATTDEDTSRIFNLTAGHCGNQGDRIYVLDGNGSRIQVGEFVASHPRTLDGKDWALVEMFVEPDMYSPPVNVTLTEWANTQALAERGGYICAIGYRSGLSCGDFDRFVTKDLFLSSGIRDHGDSGGAVWILDGDKSYAVGMASSIDYDDGAGMYITTVDAALNRYRLTLLTDR